MPSINLTVDILEKITTLSTMIVLMITCSEWYFIIEGEE
jgi:hypothetical protein